MHVQWYGQSAFRLSSQQGTVFIDPFADFSSASSHGVSFDYPPIKDVAAELLLVTHEHMDHNGVQSIDGDPVILRSTAGKLESPFGEVTAIASEHDERAGTERGPNTIFVFTFDGVRVCHFGDFGQSSLRDEQADAIGDIDLLIIPVGGGPTIGAEQAKEIVDHLRPKWVVPMHYRTPRISFLDTAEEFLELMGRVERLESSGFHTTDISADAGMVAVVPAAP